MTMLESLRSILPPIVLDFKHKFWKRVDSAARISLCEHADKYAIIFDECDKVLDWHVFIQEWIGNALDTEGDCWNDSSICAEMLAHLGKYPYIIGFTIPGRAYHLECAECKGDKFRFWDADPCNELAHYTFTNTGWIDLELWEDAWDLCCRYRYGASPEFRHFGYVADGMATRQLISKAFPNFPLAVQLTPLDGVKNILAEGDYTLQ